MPLVPMIVTRFTYKAPAETPTPSAISHRRLGILGLRGTAAGDECTVPPTTPAGHSVPRVCVSGRNDSGVS